MSSWRDTVSVEAQDDLDGLTALVLETAERHLASHGEFAPFAAGISQSGEASLSHAAPDGDESSAADLLEALYEGAREEAATERAVAFAADVALEGSDAVQIELEHREGVALCLIVPYGRRRLRRGVTFSGMTVNAGDPRVWTS